MSFFIISLFLLCHFDNQLIGEWRGKKTIEVDFIVSGNFEVPFICTFTKDGEFELRAELEGHQVIFEAFKSYYGLSSQKYTLYKDTDSDYYTLELRSEVGSKTQEVSAKLIFRSKNEIDLFLKGKVDEKHRLNLIRQL